MLQLKCCSSSSPRTIKSSSSSIRYNCQNICSWWRRPKTFCKLEKGHIFLRDQQAVLYKFFKDFTNHRKKANRVVVFSHWSTIRTRSLKKIEISYDLFNQLGVTEICSFRVVLEGKSGKGPSMKYVRLSKSNICMHFNKRMTSPKQWWMYAFA